MTESRIDETASGGVPIHGGFCDLQVNGYAGVDFNDDAVSVDAIGRACEAMRGDGVRRFLATVITDTVDCMADRIACRVKAIETDGLVRSMMAGIHVEGPFINPSSGTAGAHPIRAIRRGDVDTWRRLEQAGGGHVRLITLAPECDDRLQVTRRAADGGVRVSAGHTDASRDELRAAIDAGLTLFTHLGNGCGQSLPRHDNIIQRALSLSAALQIGWIADGIHVPPFALSNYIRLAGVDRCWVVTDAMAATGLGPGRYRLGATTVDVDDEARAQVADGDGRLAGSVVTMRRVCAVLRDSVGLSADDIDRLTRRNPLSILNEDAP
ncbi:MAG: N-acetylglucosamine-6-phosphate deacetylase [Planctomycetota bacterium]